MNEDVRIENVQIHHLKGTVLQYGCVTHTFVLKTYLFTMIFLILNLTSQHIF